MKISLRAIELLKRLEGLRCEAYQCQAKRWTIGYGHTKDVTSKDRITHALAENYLRQDLVGVETRVTKLCQNATQTQFDALVLFEFNTGGLEHSILRKKFLAGDIEGAAKEFDQWAHFSVDGKMQISAGLVARRKAEKELFLS